MLLWIHFTDTRNQKLLSRFLSLVLDPLVVCLAESSQFFERFDIARVLVRVIVKLQTVCPARLVQVQKHFLLTLVFAIVDSNRIVVFVETSHFSDHTGWLEVSNVRSGLPRLSAHHHHLPVNASESVYHDLAFN